MKSNVLDVIYRPSHFQVPLIEVIKDLECWKEFDLKLELNVVNKGSEAQRLLVQKKVDLAIGQHLRPLADRLNGIPILYLAQAQNWTNDRLAVSDMKIHTMTDLKGKKIATTKSFNHHPMLTIRLFLKKNGVEPERDGVQFVPIAEDLDSRLEAVAKGRADALFVHPPFDLKAEQMGLKLIDFPPMPMISGVTFTALSPFVAQNEVEVKNLMKTFVYGIWFFKTKKEETLSILEKRIAHAMELKSSEAFEYVYQQTADSLEEKLYPTLEAIQNVYAVAQIPYPEVRTLNPLSMWDCHYMREIDEEGFVDQLYSS